jgi:hypothetical protein
MESTTERRNRLARERRAARSVEQRAQDNEVRRARRSAFLTNEERQTVASRPRIELA